jgi:hypothetical protein
VNDEKYTPDRRENIKSVTCAIVHWKMASQTFLRPSLAFRSFVEIVRSIFDLLAYAESDSAETWFAVLGTNGSNKNLNRGLKRSSSLSCSNSFRGSVEVFSA